MLTSSAGAGREGGSEVTDLIARLTSPMDAGNRAQPDSVVVHFDSVEQLAQYRAAIIHALKVQQAAEVVKGEQP